jgi:aerobic carbon-monoxide dehydrogenase small subunit
MQVHLTLNGTARDIEVEPLERALDVLRRIGLTGTKEGCGEGECGTCTILMNGVPVNSCLAIASQLDGSQIVTVEGLASGEVLSALQRLFVERGATQCGICTPGILVTAEYLLREVRRPAHDGDASSPARFDVDAIRAWAALPEGSRDGEIQTSRNAEIVDREIRTCLAGNICRCTGYEAIVRAVRDALREALSTAAGQR